MELLNCRNLQQNGLEELEHVRAPNATRVAVRRASDNLSEACDLADACTPRTPMIVARQGDPKKRTSRARGLSVYDEALPTRLKSSCGVAFQHTTGEVSEGYAIEKAFALRPQSARAVALVSSAN